MKLLITLIVFIIYVNLTLGREIYREETSEKALISSLKIQLAKRDKEVIALKSKIKGLVKKFEIKLKEKPKAPELVEEVTDLTDAFVKEKVQTLKLKRDLSACEAQREIDGIAKSLDDLNGKMLKDSESEMRNTLELIRNLVKPAKPAIGLEDQEDDRSTEITKYEQSNASRRFFPFLGGLGGITAPFTIVAEGLKLFNVGLGTLNTLMTVGSSIFGVWSKEAGGILGMLGKGMKDEGKAFEMEENEAADVIEVIKKPVRGILSENVARKLKSFVRNDSELNEFLDELNDAVENLKAILVEVC